jgi:hypothetical protein
LYTQTTLSADLGEKVDMDYLTKVIPKVLKNRHMVRFFVHILFRNIDLLPQFIRFIVQ